jgi:hypothetical protein
MGVMEKLLTVCSEDADDHHVAVSMTALWRRLGVSPGAKAATRFAQQLDLLPDGWHVLHTVPVGDAGTEIDHLVIGPGGVFNVTTKCRPNSTVWLSEDVLRVNGHRTDYLREARAEAAQVGRVLSAASGEAVDSIAVIVFIDLLKITVRGHPHDVMVTTLRGVRHLLRHQPRRLAPKQIDHIVGVAREVVACQPA